MICNDEDRLHQIWKAYRTTMGMLRDRGYEVDPTQISISKDDLQRKMRSRVTQTFDDAGNIQNQVSQSEDRAFNLNQKYSKKFTAEEQKELDKLDAENDRVGRDMQQSQLERQKSIFVSWAVDFDKISGDHIRQIYEIGMQINCQKAILIMNDQTNVAKRLESSDTIVIEKFGLEDLQVNITKHNYVPLHMVLQPQQKQSLLEKYMIKESQLPRIQKEDAIARYFGVQSGDVMKIVRPSQTGGKYITYRYVI